MRIVFSSHENDLAIYQWWYLFLNFSGAKLYPRGQNQVFEKRVQTSTSSYSNQWVTSLNVMANCQALSHKHMICKESLSCGSLYTWDLGTLVETSTHALLNFVNYQRVSEN